MKQSSISDDLKFVEYLVTKSGPDPWDYADLDEWFKNVYGRFLGGEFERKDLLALRDAFGAAMSPATMQGLVCAQSHGYPGDFEIIDKIYVRHVSPDPSLMFWDAYFHSRHAAKAVRNRKTYFHQLLDRHFAHVRPLKVLKLASGPGRSMFEWIDSRRVKPGQVNFECIELDANAIRYATVLNQDFMPFISFQQKNVIRIQPQAQYDLIWAAGLFDYFNDNIFQSVVKRLLPAIAPGGELVIGNFSSFNQSRPYMEFGGWSLFHRTHDELIALALEAGASRELISVDSEPEKVNLFLHIRSR